MVRWLSNAQPYKMQCFWIGVHIKSFSLKNSQISEFLLFLQTVKTMNVSFEDVELDETHYGQR